METAMRKNELIDKLRSEILSLQGFRPPSVGAPGEVIHVVVRKCFDISSLLRGLNVQKEEDPDLLTLSRADEKDEYVSHSVNPKTQVRKKAVQLEIFPFGRNFR